MGSEGGEATAAVVESLWKFFRSKVICFQMDQEGGGGTGLKGEKKRINDCLEKQDNEQTRKKEEGCQAAFELTPGLH